MPPKISLLEKTSSCLSLRQRAKLLQCVHWVKTSWTHACSQPGGCHCRSQLRMWSAEQTLKNQTFPPESEVGHARSYQGCWWWDKGVAVSSAAQRGSTERAAVRRRKDGALFLGQTCFAASSVIFFLAHFSVMVHWSSIVTSGRPSVGCCPAMGLSTWRHLKMCSPNLGVSEDVQPWRAGTRAAQASKATPCSTSPSQSRTEPRGCAGSTSSHHRKRVF